MKYLFTQKLLMQILVACAAFLISSVCFAEEHEEDEEDRDDIGASIEHHTSHVRPMLNCVTKFDDKHFVAFFGYKNKAYTVKLLVGDQNRFDPLDINRGQPEIFQPGRHKKVFSVPFDGNNLIWKLAGRTAKARRTSKTCPGLPSDNLTLRASSQTMSGGIKDGSTILNPKRLPIEDEFPVVQHRGGPLGDRGPLTPSVSSSERIVAQQPAQGLPQTPLPVVSAQATNTNVGFLPGDPQIAVSSTHVVVSGPLTAHFYRRNFAADGTEMAPTVLALRTMVGIFGTFATMDLGITMWNDTRAIFDPYRRRFVIVVLGYTSSATIPSYTLVAYSNSENPADGFLIFAYSSTASEVFQTGDSTDYPSIGVASHTFIDNHVVANDMRRYIYTAILPIESILANNGNGSFTYYYDMTNPGGSKVQDILQPAVHYTNSDWSFLATRLEQSKIVVWGLPNFQSTKSFFATTVDLSDFMNPVDAQQKGSTRLIAMTNLGSSILKAVFRDGRLYLTSNDARDWGNIGKVFTSVRLVRLDLSNAPTISNSGPVFIDRTFGSNNAFEDAPDLRFHYGWPAVEVTQNGDMVVIYARSGETIFPEARYSVRLANDPDMRASRVLKQGEASYADPQQTDTTLPFRWGDLGGATLDPRDNLTVWVTHMYATATPPSARIGNWQLWMGRIDPQR